MFDEGCAQDLKRLSLSSLPSRDILICYTLRVPMLSEATDQRARGRGV